MLYYFAPKIGTHTPTSNTYILITGLDVPKMSAYEGSQSTGDEYNTIVFKSR